MRVLTKSRFKLGLECPNKLFFTSNKNYANQKKADSFLEALAEGGFQVEELSRMTFPDGTLIEGTDGEYEALWNRTKDLLEKDNATIYEAAFLHGGLFIRTDVLVKKGNTIELIEVKAKSFDSTKDHIFLTTSNNIRSEWKAYLFDIAFQKYVAQKCYPDLEVKSYIMMADKSKMASVDGLNQLFRIAKNKENRTGIEVLAEDISELGDPVLSRVDISDIVEDIINGTHKYYPNLAFQEAVVEFQKTYGQEEYYNWPTSYTACKNCEFKTTKEDMANNLKSGFEYCFTEQNGWKPQDFERPNIFEIGGLYHGRGKDLFNDKRYFMDEVTKEDLKYKKGDGKLSSTERQWIQIEKEVSEDDTIFVDKAGLKAELASWVFPLHFIDFETSASALPFHKDRSPYEQIAFQFSHHIVHENGNIEHASEFLEATAGKFPNFDFIRELKKALENDTGSVFRYSSHENTILNAIFRQLDASDEPDKKELKEFIQSITKNTSDSDIEWEGERNMIDLLDPVKNFYYNPFTRGSNSIKAVLPAILKSSDFLQKKYSKKLNDINLTSLNFSGDHIWLQIKDGEVLSPYKSLPSIFEDWTDDAIENSMSGIDSISDGGAALAAYGKLQYSDMSKEEIDEIKSALLKYCELDTLAMVMIYEHFLELLQ